MPNPMKKSTRFFFNTQLSFDTEVQIKIYSQSGTLVRVLRNVVPGVTKWDGKDSFGQRLGSGLYFYKLLAEVVEEASGISQQTTTKKYSHIGKLVISR